MIIKSIAASLPSRIVTNDDMIDIIREQSTEYEGDLERMLKITRRFLHQSGLQQRHWCDHHELPIDHVAKATRAVLDDCYLRRSHIELLIYVGVGRGFLEPGNSHMMANALGFDNAQCFDIVDACMSWVRALQLVDSLFKSGSYRNALIINAEFNASGAGPLNSNRFSINKEEDLLYTFPTFTIGEAATATLLVPKTPENFEFYFSSRADLSDLCTIPLNGYEEFCHPNEKIGMNGPLQFTSYGIELHSHAKKETISIFRKMSNKDSISVVFVHASCITEWNQAAKDIGVEEKLYHIYQDTGNIVSASIPVAMHDAINSGSLNRGDRIVFWVGSAGMSFSATRLIY